MGRGLEGRSRKRRALIWADTFIVPNADRQSAAGPFRETIRSYRCNHRDARSLVPTAGDVKPSKCSENKRLSGPLALPLRSECAEPRWKSFCYCVIHHLLFFEGGV